MEVIILYYEISKSNELYHHGIKDMKWGIRRYQNPDGSLTPEGKKRYQKSDGSLNTRGKISTYSTDKNYRKSINAKYDEKLNSRTIKNGKDKEKLSPTENALKKTKSVIDDTSNIADSIGNIQSIKSNSKINKEIKTMSDAELKRRIDRLQMEQRYSQLSQADTSKGLAYTQEILAITGSVVGIGASAAGIAATIHSLKHSDLVDDFLMHYGVPGMKWGHRKDQSYTSTGVRSAIARHKNAKIDKSFNEWKENAQKRDNAIALGKKSNEARIAYENNKSDKALKSASKQATKEYKKALKQNTTYRRGQIKHEVGSDLSRKYLSSAKKVKKKLDADPTNKQLKKQYNQLMSKHDTERAKARRAPQVAENRSKKKASFKRSMTMTAKAVATTAAVTAGTMAVNAYLKKNNVKFNGMNVNISQSDVSKFNNFIKFGKDVFKYFN